jgi:hypothetical protein
VVTLRKSRVAECRTLYPGYLALFPDLYARTWAEIARKR